MPDDRSGLPYIRCTASGGYLFQRKQHRTVFPQDPRQFYRHYADALAASGLSAFRVRASLQSAPGCLSHAIQQWRQAKRRHKIEDSTADALCSVGGWLHTGHLTAHNIDTLTGHGSSYSRSRRYAVLRSVLLNTGRTSVPAPHTPIMRRATPQARTTWTAQHLHKFRDNFPDSTAEGTALNIMLYGMPTWQRLTRIGWDDLAEIAIAGSAYHSHLVHRFQHIPPTAKAFIRHSVPRDRQGQNSGQAQCIRSLMQSACSELGLPHLTASSVSHLNAQTVASFIVPDTPDQLRARP